MIHNDETRAADCFPERQLTPSRRENNSGLRQELQNLEISKNHIHIITLNNTEKLTKTISGIDGGINCSNSVPMNLDPKYSPKLSNNIAIGLDRV